MPRFDPGPDEQVLLEFTDHERRLRVVPHPKVSSMAHAMEGGKAVVYRLRDEQDGCEYALKVFKTRYREPELVRICQQLDPLKTRPGLAVCERVCLSPAAAGASLQRFPELKYAVLMPWVAGRSWFDSLQTAAAPVLDLDRVAARRLATHLALVLSGLERQGIAHCDLSAANLLVDKVDLKVDLIDVEDLFAPGLSRPRALPAGTPGYQHSTSATGQWNAAADRFAGAVLLAEILGWYEPEVRAKVFGESYFDPAELQTTTRGDRYRTLHGALLVQSPALASLWATAWSSSTLLDCPQLAAWETACRALFPFEPIDLAQTVIESGPRVFWSGPAPTPSAAEPTTGWRTLSPGQRPPPPVRWHDSEVDD